MAKVRVGGEEGNRCGYNMMSIIKALRGKMLEGASTMRVLQQLMCYAYVHVNIYTYIIIHREGYTRHSPFKTE